MKAAREAGHDIAQVHHWNFSKSVYPARIVDPRHLVPTPTRAVHEQIHRATSSTTDIWVGPVDPAMEDKHSRMVNTTGTEVVMDAYRKVYDAVGLDQRLIDCALGKISLPVIGWETAQWYGFPPALIPIWSTGSRPTYLGLWKHWFWSVQNRT